MWFVIDMVDKVSDCGAQNYGYLVLGGSLGYDLRGVRTVGIYPPTRSRPNNYSMMGQQKKKLGYDFNILRLISEDFSLAMPTNVEPKLRCKIFTLEEGNNPMITATSATNKKER